MKKIVQFLCIIPVLLSACNTKCIEDSGKHIEKKVSFTAFEKIEVSGAIKLVLKQDSSYVVKIATDSNLMDYVTVEQKGSKLNISMKKSSYCGADSIVVEAGIGKLTEITASGAVRTLSNARINTGDLKLNLSGSTETVLDVNASKITSIIDGVGKMKLYGQAGAHQLSITGTGDIDASDFITGIYNIEITGNAKANINVLNELNVRTEGASDIHYKGNPKKVNEKKSGAATLEKVN